MLRLEACNACQLRCPACPTTQGRIQDRLGTGYLTFQRFRDLVDANPWVRTIELSNWGEIFLNPDLRRIIAHAYARGVRLRARNGVNFNDVSDATLVDLVRYRFRALKLSIDGTTQDVYSTYRKRGDLSQVMANLRRLVDLKREHRSEFPRLKWQFIAFGHNEHQIEEARALAKELGMSFWVKLAWRCPHTLEDVAEVRDQELVGRASGLGVATRDDYYRVTRERYMQRHSCSQLWTSPQIHFDGRLLGCNILHDGDFGNVFEEGLLAALNNEKISYARRMLLGRAAPRDDIPCSRCKHYLSMREHRRWIREQDVDPAPRRARWTRRLAAALGVRSRPWRGSTDKVTSRADWLTAKAAGAASRSRGLARFSELFDPADLRVSIEAARRAGRRPRLAEIGCGEGRLLLELWRDLGDVEAHGINKRPWPAMVGRRSLRDTARRNGIDLSDAVEDDALPEVWFYDAQALHFDDSSVDLVVSQTAIPYVLRKDRLLEEVWRVLVPGGTAILHVDTWNARLPDALRQRTPRFVIDRGAEDPATLFEVVDELRARGHDVTLREIPSRGDERRLRVVMLIRKNGAAPLRLGLDIDAARSVNLPRINPAGGADDVFWGRRSVFQRAGTS